MARTEYAGTAFRGELSTEMEEKIRRDWAPAETEADEAEDDEEEEDEDEEEEEIDQPITSSAAEDDDENQYEYPLTTEDSIVLDETDEDAGTATVTAEAEPTGEDEDEEEEDEEEPSSSGVTAGSRANNDLRPYEIQEIDQNVYISKVPGKGRCLFARKPYKPGDILFIESPFLVALPQTDPELWKALSEINEQEPLYLPPIWHMGAICSLTKLGLPGQRIVGDKFVPDPDAAPSADVIRVLKLTGLALDPQRYERALNAWRINGFGHHTQNDGLVMYNRVSNMAHSCCASVSWHFGENDSFVVRARQHLKPGDELTISYIGDEDILKATHLRRERLQGWQFTCQCDRCGNPADRSRGFRCPDCGVGTVNLKSETTEDDSYKTTATPCTVCKMDFDASQISQYEAFEEAYINRLQDTSKEYLSDVELVYQEATRVFTHHWVMYELDTMLFEGYKDNRRWNDAIHHQKKRVDFVLTTNPAVSFTLAGMHEDLGDLLANVSTEQKGDISKINGFQRNAISRAYEDAFNSLIVLCGAVHDYTLAAHAKFDQIINVQVEE